MAGISREHLNRIEAGKVTLTDDMQDKLMGAVEKFNPDAPMFLLFDYVRIRFPTLDIQHVIKDILKLNIDYMLHEDYGHYKYTEHYYLGDVFVSYLAGRGKRHASGAEREKAVASLKAIYWHRSEAGTTSSWTLWLRAV